MAGDEQTAERAAALEREAAMRDWLADEFIRQDDRLLDGRPGDRGDDEPQEVSET